MQKRSKVYRFVLDGVLKGKDRVFRGHKFVKGVMVVCCNEDRLAAVLNSFRNRLPTEEVDERLGEEGLAEYLKYCEEAKVPVDRTAVHNFDKREGQVNLNPVTEDVEDEVDADLDSELDELLGADDEVETEDDMDADSEVEDSEAEDVVEGPAPDEVDPAVVRENQIRAALGQLDHDNPDHWTSVGLPKLDIVGDYVEGEPASRKEVNTVAPDFKRGS